MAGNRNRDRIGGLAGCCLDFDGGLPGFIFGIERCVVETGP